MQDRTIEKIRKYKRDHNMKQTEHGLVVMECRLKKEILAGSSYANAYISVTVPFYDASIRELVGWMRETFPGLERVSDVADIHVNGQDMELFQTAHGRADKNGNAPLILTFRILNRSSFRGFEDLSMESMQKLFDEAYGLQAQTDDEEDTSDASPAAIVL
jgi:hypothetical protein